MIQEYILTIRLYKTLEKKLGERFKCRKCGFPFQIGDVVVSKPIRGGRKVLYHEKCYEELFVNGD